jgi:predicted secreted protein
MSIGTGIALYFIFWWLCLFAVLPFGVRSQKESGNVEPGTEPGAPQEPYLWRKILINSVAAAIVFAIYWFVTVGLGYGIDSIPSPFPQDR